jgi:hypothetical protein
MLLGSRTSTRAFYSKSHEITIGGMTQHPCPNKSARLFTSFVFVPWERTV